MKKKQVWFWLTAVTLLSLVLGALVSSTSFAQVEGKLVFLPLVVKDGNVEPTTTQTPPSPTITPTATATATPTPDLCNAPVYTDTLDPSSWPYPGYFYMTITSTYQVAWQAWTNLPNREQTLQKVRLGPQDGPVYFVGGGYVEYWDSSCTQQVDDKFASWELPEATLEDLSNQGLLIDLAVCSNPIHLPPRDPVPGDSWQFGDDSNIIVGRNWTNWPGFDQTPWRTIYGPIETVYPLKGGGEISLFSIGCGQEAQEFFDQFADLPVYTTEELNQMGLFAWPTIP